MWEGQEGGCMHDTFKLAGGAMRGPPWPGLAWPAHVHVLHVPQLQRARGEAAHR